MSDDILALIDALGLASIPDDDSRRAEWIESALCAQTDPVEWFPESGVSPRAAKRICMACPVRKDCEDYVRTRFEETGFHEHGVWAGLSRRQRLKKFKADGTRSSTRNPHQDAAILSMRRAHMSALEIARQVGLSARSVERVFQRAKDTAA